MTKAAPGLSAISSSFTSKPPLPLETANMGLFRLSLVVQLLAEIACCSTRKVDADRHGKALIPVDSEGSYEDAEQQPKKIGTALARGVGGGRRAMTVLYCCSVCNFDPQYQATSIAYCADRRATHAPNNNLHVHGVSTSETFLTRMECSNVNSPLSPLTAAAIPYRRCTSHA